jgi:hypothetical protein
LQAYSVGLKKTFDLFGKGVLGIGGEITELSQSKESLINLNGYNWGGDWYSHWSILEGYTNGGQVLGASIGNGSSAQIASADFYMPIGHVGLELRRWANRLSALYLGSLPANRENLTDVEYRVALKFDWLYERWTIGLELAWEDDLNRYMIQGNDVINYRAVITTVYRI